MIEGLKPYPRMKHFPSRWLRNIPAHWDVRRLKSLCRMQSGGSITAESIESSGPYPVYGGNGIRGFTNAYNHDGQYVLIGRQGALCGNIHVASGKLWASEHAVVVMPREAINIRWLGELLRAMDLGQYSIAAAQPGLAVDRILELHAPVPPPDEQVAIGRFTSHLDLRLGQIIRAKKELTRLLEEQRQTAIEQALVGDNSMPRATHDRLSWFGHIPSHWEVVRSKRLFHPRNEYARPNDAQLSATQAYGVIPQEEFERRIGRKVTKITQHLDRRRHVEVDDFVISMRSFQGGLERAWATGCIRSSYVVLRPGKGVDIDFFTYLFKSRPYIRALQSTANFIRDGQDLNFANFCAVDLPLPPLEEQRQIAERVRRDTITIRQSVACLQQEIALLHELRQRLMRDALAGQIDVRVAATGLPELTDTQVYVGYEAGVEEDHLDSDDAADREMIEA